LKGNKRCGLIWTSATSNVAGGAAADCVNTALQRREERIIPANARIVIRTSAEIQDETDYAGSR
jgi:hypothetical protein